MEKPEIKTAHNAKVFARVAKPKPLTKTGKKPIPLAELKNTPWGKFIIYLDNNLDGLTPRNFDKQKDFANLATIQIKCLELLAKIPSDNWDDLLDEIADAEYKQAENFYFHLSRKYFYTPQQFTSLWEEKIKEFISLFPDIISSESPDLLKLESFADIIDSFNRFPERTFFFLYKLPNYLDAKDGEILINCRSYQKILSLGASEYIGKFGYKLQKEFKITRTAIKEKAAQNLVQELGETEANLKAEINRLEDDKEDLQRQLKYLEENSFQDAVFQLAKSLQNEQQQPVLDQLFNLYKKIDKLLEDSESLSPQDTLTCFINLENFFQALSSFNIHPYPPNTETILEITGEDLDNNKYNYISGSQFTSKEEVKKVKCLACGWQVGDEIVTPAKVAEITDSTS